MKDKKVQELLSVLDMSEEEQWSFIGKQFSKDPRYNSLSLADLAFRLRDEAIKLCGWQIFNNAMEIVWGYWCKKTWPLRKSEGAKKQHIKKLVFWSGIAEPIHKIIAALIAEELGK